LGVARVGQAIGHARLKREHRQKSSRDRADDQWNHHDHDEQLDQGKTLLGRLENAPLVRGAWRALGAYPSYAKRPELAASHPTFT
jgi:hypothetical protein